MEQHEMVALVELHLKAEGAGDVEGAAAVYTDDVVHDAVGMAGSPRTGKEAAKEFYRYLTANFRTEAEEPLNRFFDADTRAAQVGSVLVSVHPRPRGSRSPESPGEAD